MKFYKTLDDVDISGKTVIVRVDINSPIDPETGRIQDNERIQAHAKTLRELSDKGAKVVVLAHQGRKGGSDFLPLKQHADLLSKHVGKPVKYVPDLLGDEAEKAIKDLKEGEIVLLENVRTLDEETIEASPEEHAKGALVSKLSKLADLFILDAFSVAHRSHASIVGFAAVLPVIAGRVMEKELEALSELLEKRDKIILFMGGNKPKDCISVIEAILKRGKPEIKLLLTAGILGQLFLMAEGRDLGAPSLEYIKKKKFDEFVEKAGELSEKLGERLYKPIDVAYEADGKRAEVKIEELPAPGPIMDIGSETAALYRKLITSATPEDAIIVKGPAGAYEHEEFRKGTREIYSALAESKAFTLIGGGDSSTAIKLVGLKIDDFSYVSLAGGALIHYLSGKTMPGVEILKRG
ncbi:MAG: phosphoglycerate kinase [Candidatus Wolframiiraptor sp.]|nr:MAG: phosphoglycerate kinase [Candidatus Wolframiiraptor sp.]